MRNHKLILVGMIFIAIIFQLFFRYAITEVGPYDIKDDRLTLTVYAKQKRSSGWRETRFKSLNQAKTYFEQKILSKNNIKERFIWDIGEDENDDEAFL